MKDFLKNLHSGLKLVLFRRVSLEAFRINVDQLVALVLFDLFLTLGADFLVNGPKGHIDYAALPGNLFYLPLLLLSGYLISKLEGELRLALAVPLILLAASPLFTCSQMLVELAQTHVPASTNSSGLLTFSSYAIWAWWLAAVFVALGRLTARGWLHKVTGFVCYAGPFLASVWYLPPDDLWSAADLEDGRNEASGTGFTEEIFHAQPAIFEQALAALQPGRKGVPDLYFVGVAGSATEDVFMKELLVIGRLLEERFDTSGRTILMINNVQTAQRFPLATRDNLAQALKRVGRLMTPEEDVLLLYITSHGSQDFKLALSYRPLELKDIDPPALQQMLKQSGIRWKVIVLSACYSGGFIEKLKDDETLIMTASDALHASFGCGAESDFTYFGKALFDDQLRRTFSFTEAFERARVAIADRERAEGEAHSNPQIVLGTAIKKKLVRLEQRLRAQTQRRNN